MVTVPVGFSTEIVFWVKMECGEAFTAQSQYLRWVKFFRFFSG
jgi:hypothetical protein